MATRRSNVRTLSILSSVLFLGVLVAANVVLARTSARVDLTEERIYTISDGSRTILQNLRDPATIKVFWHNVQSKSEPTRRYVEVLLDEIQRESDLVQVQWIDLDDDAGIKEAQKLGVKQYLFGSVEGEEVRQSKGYKSLTVELGGESALIIDHLDAQRDQLEYQILAEIHRRTRLSTPVIGLVRGSAGLQMGERKKVDFRVLEYRLREVFGDSIRADIDISKPVPVDVDVLLVMAPKDWDDLKVYHLEQFVLRGGRLVLALDPVGLRVLLAKGATGQPMRSGIEDWLKQLGITVDAGLVADFKSHGVYMHNGLFRYPYWPVVTGANGDQTNPVVRSFSSTVFRWPAGFTVDEKAQTDAGRTVSVLATTTDGGYRRDNAIGIKAFKAERPEGKLLEKVPLVLAIDGPIESAWNKKPLPKPPDAIGPGDMPFGPGDDSGSPDGDATGSPDGDATGSPDGAAPPAKPDESKPDAPKPDAPDAPKKAEPATDGAGGPAGEEDAGEEDAGEEDDAPSPEDAPAPDDAGADDEPAPAPVPAPVQEERSQHLTTGSGRILLLGDAGLASDVWFPHQRAGRQIRELAYFNQSTESGFNFFLNATDWLGGSDELLSLRSRNDNPRTLQKLEPKDRKLTHWVNILAVPLLVLLAGLVVFVIRRR